MTGTRAAKQSIYVDPGVFLKFCIAGYVLFYQLLSEMLRGALFGVVAPVESLGLYYVLKSVEVFLLLWPLTLNGRKYGLLHPLVFTTVAFPFLGTLFNFSGLVTPITLLLIGEPLNNFVHNALRASDPQELVDGRIGVTLLNILSMVVWFGAFFLIKLPSFKFPEFSNYHLKRSAQGYALGALACIALFLVWKGGVSAHISALGLGRFNALEGAGPIVVFLGGGPIALMLWLCIDPRAMRSKIFILLAIITALSQFLINGSRGAVFFSVIMIAVAWMLSNKKIPWKLIAVGLPLALMLYGSMTVARYAVRLNTDPVSAVLDGNFADHLTAGARENNSRGVIRGELPVFLYGIEKTDGPLLGETYLGGIFYFVPRAIWENKPRSAGSYYPHYFLGASKQGTSIPVGPVIEAYWNFHVGGVVLVFLIFGIMQRWMCEMYERNPNSSVVKCVFVLMILYLEDPETASIVRFEQSVLILSVIVFFAWLFTKRSKKYRILEPVKR